MQKFNLVILFLLSSFCGYAQTEECDDPMISSFTINLDSTLGSYNKDCCPASGTDTYVQMTDTAGVSSLYYSTGYVFVNTSSLAYFTMGSWATALVPEAQDLTFKLPRVVTEDLSGDENTASSGTIGIAVDGVVIFSETTSKSYDTSEEDDLGGTGDGYWNQDAWVNEAYSMDATGAGHSNAVGTYHYHATPIALYSDLTAGHSPIVGWGLDGVPIYGPFGYNDPTDVNSEVVRIESSYVLRNITERTTLPSGEVLDPAYHGPDVTATGDYTIGWYVEDYEYDETEGHLDEHNGRWCKTPEYPDGIYAYFVTEDIAGSPQYPYFIGPDFYGETVTAGGGYANIPANADLFDPELCDDECALAGAATISASKNGICIGEETTLTILGDLNDAEGWVWYTESCGGTQVGTGTILDVSPTVNTVYYARGEGTCGDGVCGSLEITILNSPSIELSEDETICSGETLDIVATAIGAVTWAHGGNGKTISVSPLVTTTYVGTATLMNGCSASDSVQVNVDELIEANAGIDQSVCDNVITLTATKPAIGTGSWAVISGSGSVVSASEYNSDLNITSSMELEWAVSNGTCLDKDTVEVVVLINSGISVSISPLSVELCDGESQEFVASVENAVATPQYEWFVNDNSQGVSGDEDITLDALLNGDEVSVKVTASSASTCDDDIAVSETVGIVVETLSIVDAGSNLTFCSPDASNVGDTITLNGSVDVVIDIVWTTSGTGTFTADNEEVVSYAMSSSDITNGSVVLTLTSEANACGSSSSDVTVTVDPCTVTSLSLDNTSESALQVFPNPWEKQLTVSWVNSRGSEGSYSIVDIVGNVVYSSSDVLSKEETIEIDLPKGIYFINAKIGGEVLVKKVVKE